VLAQLRFVCPVTRNLFWILALGASGCAQPDDVGTQETAAIAMSPSETPVLLEGNRVVTISQMSNMVLGPAGAAMLNFVSLAAQGVGGSNVSSLETFFNNAVSTYSDDVPAAAIQENLQMASAAWQGRVRSEQMGKLSLTTYALQIDQNTGVQTQRLSLLVPRLGTGLIGFAGQAIAATFDTVSEPSVAGPRTWQLSNAVVSVLVGTQDAIVFRTTGTPVGNPAGSPPSSPGGTLSPPPTAPAPSPPSAPPSSGVAPPSSDEPGSGGCSLAGTPDAMGLAWMLCAMGLLVAAWRRSRLGTQP
jgi:hypothetical protein